MSLPIRGRSWGSVGHAFEVAKRRGARNIDFLRDYLIALYADSHTVGIRADVLVAQADLETAAFTSARWDEGNPAGIAITDNKPAWEAGPSFTPQQAARAHVTHMCGYLGIVPPPGWTDTDPRWAAMIAAGYYGSVSTVADLGNGRWATDPQYATKIASRWNQYAFTEPKAQEAPVTMNTPYAVNWPGLPGGSISFTFPFSTQYIVPAWRTQQRPGIIARQPRLPVQHENGNPGAYAEQDSIYLYNGAGGRTASWHATVDHMKGFANLPANEVGWQASDGSGPGNMQGFAIELSQRSLLLSSTAARQARRNAAEVMGRVCIARLKGKPPAKMHRDYAPDRKNCPQYFIANVAAWNQYVDDVMMFANDELTKMGQAPVEPSEPVVIYIGDTIKALVPLNVRQAPRLAAPTLGTLDVGDTVVVNGRFESADGYGWLPVSTKFGDGAVAMGDENGPFIEKVVAPPPPKPIEYAPKMPVRELLLTNLDVYDTAEGITTVNELEFVFVADVVEFTKETPAAQHAGEGAPAVKAAYRAGERAIAAWLVKTKERGWWYLLAGDDDEWVRVPYANTKRVSDAPLLGDDME